MAGDEKKTGLGEGGQEGKGPTGDAQGPKSLEDLKAKLGIVTKPKSQPQAETALPKRTTESDFQFSLNAPVAEAPLIKEPSEVSAVVVEKRGLSLQWGVAFAVIAVVVLVVGLFFGKVMKERAIENFKIKEAAFILEYFMKARSDKIAASEGTTLDVVKAHVNDTLAVWNALQKATTPEAQAQALQQLEQYLERCRAYRDKEPLFSIEAVFPGVIFNQELAAKVVRYIEAVKQLYDETTLLALEAETLKRVTELEERGEMVETVYIEPVEEDGEKWYKGVFIAQMDRENPRKEKGVVEYPVLPVGAEKGFFAPTTSLVKVDVSPIARNKSARYRAAIQARVRARLAKVKEAADGAVFDGLEEALKKVASRSPLFTIF